VRIGNPGRAEVTAEVVGIALAPGWGCAKLYPMKDRTVWTLIVAALLVLGAIYILRRGGTATKPAPVATRPVVPATSAATPPVAPLVASPPAPSAGLMVQAGPHGELVPIQDGKTIDMSSGRAVVKDDARSRTAIAQGVKEMEDAANSVKFGPRPAAPAEKKKAEPPPAPPKS
jgi:hypothetical protein